MRPLVPSSTAALLYAVILFVLPDQLTRVFALGSSSGSEGRAGSIEPQTSWSKQSYYAGMSPYRVKRPFLMKCFQRDEKDLVQLQSGIEHGITLGTPIGLFVKNEDQRPRDYSEVWHHFDFLHFILHNDSR